MPRLEPGGPGLAVSPDNAFIAVAHDGKLSLIDSDKREVCASVDLPAGDTDIYLSSQRVFAFVRMESSTGCMTFALPTLEPVTSMELIGLAMPLGGVQDRVLVTGMNGETPRILSLVGKILNADPIALREPVQFAAEAPEGGLLVAARDQLECWDPLRRRALFKLHLPVTAPKLGGFASRRRQLWMVSSSAAGPLEVYRFSDGRLQARAELGKRVVAVDGHPDSPRLVVAARHDGQPAELVQFNLAAGERYPVKLTGVPASYAVVDGLKPVLVVGRADGTIDYVNLPRATPLEEPIKARPQKSEPGAGSDKLAGWRNRLAGEKPEVLDAARRLANPPRRREEAKPVRSSPVREAARREAATAPSTPTPMEPIESPMTLQPTGGWRSSLCAWAQAALDAPGHAEPPPGDQDTTLSTLVARLSLSAGAARGLALLYGQWLLGDGKRGVPLATLAQAVGTAPDDSGDSDEGAHWVEALLRGSLGRARLCRIAGGRVRLRPLAARFLDGRAPRLKLVSPPADARPIAVTRSQRLYSELSVEEIAGLAQKLGRVLAVIPAGAGVEARLTEARLHDVLPLVLGAKDAESWAPFTAEQPVLCAFDEECLELRDLPALE